jgi:hypothetical protein
MVMTGLLLTLRIVSGGGQALHPANAWIALSVLAGYAMIVLTLPRCHMDRHGSRFCRETNPDTTGPNWLAGLMLSFFLMGCVVVNESSQSGISSATPLSWLGIIGALGSILGVGTVIYGMRNVPITNKENQHLYIRGAFVDTEEQSVRILPGYGNEKTLRNPELLGAFVLT